MSKFRKLAELQIAMMTLTRLPVGRVGTPAPDMAAARWAYPLVGSVVGALVGGVFWIASALGLPLTVAALIAITAGIIATGGLHEDGLADCADGFGGGRDRDTKLEIMRDSRIGTYGALALILSVGLRATALAALAAPVWSVLTVAMVSRFATLVALERMPPARDSGLGAEAAKGPDQVVLGSIAVVAIVLLSLIAIGPMVFLAFATMALAGFLWSRLALKHVGGQTGDVLGGMQQVTEIAGLIALSALAL